MHISRSILFTIEPFHFTFNRQQSLKEKHKRKMEPSLPHTVTPRDGVGSISRSSLRGRVPSRPGRPAGSNTTAPPVTLAIDVPLGSAKKVASYVNGTMLFSVTEGTTGEYVDCCAINHWLEKLFLQACKHGHSKMNKTHQACLFQYETDSDHLVIQKDLPLLEDDPVEGMDMGEACFRVESAKLYSPQTLFPAKKRYVTSRLSKNQFPFSYAGVLPRTDAMHSMPYRPPGAPGLDASRIHTRRTLDVLGVTNVQNIFACTGSAQELWWILHPMLENDASPKKTYDIMINRRDAAWHAVADANGGAVIDDAHPRYLCPQIYPWYGDVSTMPVQTLMAMKVGVSIIDSFEFMAGRQPSEQEYIACTRIPHAGVSTLRIDAGPTHGGRMSLWF